MKSIESWSMKLAAAAVIALSSPSSHALSVSHVQNASVGQFLSSAGAALTAGGVSVGFFSIAIPTAADWVSLAAEPIAQAYSRLASAEFGFTDLRTLAGVTTTGVDWNNPAPVTGVVTNISLSVLPQGTPLFVLAFNNGTWNPNQALSFLSSTEWAAVGASAWLAPSSLGNTPTNLNVAGGVQLKVGVDSSPSDSNVRLSAPVPEPASAILLGSGLLCVFSLRRRTSHA